jgi:hypothetical protein
MEEEIALQFLIFLIRLYVLVYRLCGLVVRVSGHRSRDLGSITRRYHIFWEVVGLERVPLSLVSTIEELLGRKNSDSGLETKNTAVGTRHSDHVAPSICKFGTTSPTSRRRSVGIVRHGDI